MGDTGVGIADEVGALHAFICAGIVGGGGHVEGLAGVKRQEAAELPTAKQRLQLGSVRQVIIEQRSEVVARVEVAISVVPLNVKAILRNSAAIGGHVIESMRPGVGELRSEAVPLANFENGLEGVVVGVSITLDLVDDAEVRELREIRAAGLLRGRRCCDLSRSHSESFRG